MHDLTVVFRSASDIEARVVRGLLESHGIASLLSSGAPQSIFPVGVGGIAQFKAEAVVQPGRRHEVRVPVEP